MSASDKKKLRKEQETEVLTKRQQQEQAEAKKLKLYTTIFVTTMVLIVAVLLSVLVVRGVTNAGVSEKATIAATIGDEKINSVVFNYYYTDAVNNYYNEQYEFYQDETDEFLLDMGLDTSKPLDEQYQDQEQTTTWADFFVQEALADAKRDYTLYNEAMANGFELDETQKAAIDSAIENLTVWAPYYGYTSENQYLRAIFGNGASVKSYRAYYERTQIADAYYDAHLADYTYPDEELRGYEAEENRYNNYTSFTYDSLYLSYSSFREGGTEDENGNKTYTAEENDAARAALKVAAEELATATTHEELHEKAEALELPDGSDATISHNTNSLYTTFSGANAKMAEWLSSEERKEGDIGLIPIVNETEVDGQKVEQTNGYFVLHYTSKNENNELISNVRHLLVKFEGGEEDATTGQTVYSEEEKAAAKAEADDYLKTWQEGEKTEESFIALVKKYSDDTTAETGGLFEDINPDSSYVSNFLNWSIDPAREAGDAEVIETEYGYHVMYYVGDDEMTYRDYMITNELAQADQTAWYDGLMEAVTATVGDLNKIKLDLVLSSAS